MLRPNSLAKRLSDAIEAGADMTVDEFADQFHVLPFKIRRTLSYLRKNGYLYYPVDTKTGKESVQGKVTKIMKSKDFIMQTMVRHDKHYLRPQLVSAFRIIEQAVVAFPALRPHLQEYVTNLLVMVKHEDKQLGKGR